MKRIMSLFLALIMCISIVPMTLIDALAHGRGVAKNDIENQSLTNMSQLPEQVDVDGYTGDTAWSEKNWNEVSSKTGTWDVKDPLHYDYSYKYQLRKDGEYFYGIIVLNDIYTNAVITVWLNDGTLDGYTDKFVFEYKDGAVDFADSRVSVDGTVNTEPSTALPAEAYQHVCVVHDGFDEIGDINSDLGTAVIEFRSLISAFSDNGDKLSAFVSATVEGVDGEESLYYPRVPYETADNVILPSETKWPEEAMDISNLDIQNIAKSDNEHQLPDTIDVDGVFRDPIWTDLSNLYEHDNGIRNILDFKDYELSDEHPNGYAFRDIVANYNTNTVVNSEYATGSFTVSSGTYYHGMDNGDLAFKYGFRMDTTSFYGGLLVHNPGTSIYTDGAKPKVETTESQIFIYIFKGYNVSGDSTTVPDYTLVMNNEETILYNGYHDIREEQNVGTIDYGDSIHSGFSYRDANISSYTIRMDVAALEQAGKVSGLSDGLSYVICVANSKKHPIPDGSYNYPRTFAFATKGNYGAYNSHAFIAHPHYSIDLLPGKGTDATGTGYKSGILDNQYFADVLGADAYINGGGINGNLWSNLYTSATEYSYLFTADYDYLYGAAIIKKSDWVEGEYRLDGWNGTSVPEDEDYVNADVFRVYLKTDNLGRALNAGYDAAQEELQYVPEAANGYLSLYINENGVACANFTKHTKGKGLTDEVTSAKDILNSDVYMKKVDGDTVVLEFKVPLCELGVEFDVSKTGTTQTLLEYYCSVENIQAQGYSALVSPKPANYKWFYDDATCENADLKLGQFYPDYWHEGSDKHIYYNGLLETFTPDGKLHEGYWDTDGDLAYVSQFNGVWDTEPQNDDIFDYRYNVYVSQDHLYGAAKLNFDFDSGISSFDVWINSDYTFDKTNGNKTFGPAATHKISVSLDENNNTVMKLYKNENGSFVEATAGTYHFVDAEKINGVTQIEFAFSLDAFDADKSGFSFCVSCTDLTDSGETLTLYHLGQKEGWSDLWVTHFNTYDFIYNGKSEDIEGDGTIFSDFSIIDADKMGYNDSYLFVPADNYADENINKYGEGVYIVHGKLLGTSELGSGGNGNKVMDLIDALNNDTALTSTEGAFLYSINAGNPYQELLKTTKEPDAWLKSNAHRPDFATYASSYNIYNYNNDFNVGTAVMFKDIDLDTFSKSTVLNDSDILWFENGYYSMEQYKVIDADAPVKNRGNGNLPTDAVWHENAEDIVSLGFYNREIIEIDGVLGDSGWDEDGWIDVNNINGTIQTDIPAGSEEFFYKYQIRTDGKYLYVGALLDTDLAGKDSTTLAGKKKLTDMIAFRLWLKSNNVESRTFTSLYDLSGSASAQTISGVKYTSPYDDAATEDGEKALSINSNEKFTLNGETMSSTVIGANAQGGSIYPVLRFAETNELGRLQPAGGLTYPLYANHGKTSGATVDNYYNYGSTALYGYTERIEENTTSGGSSDWYSKPITTDVTFANEHGKILPTADGTQTVIEFKIALDEFDGQDGFEYYVQASSTAADHDPYALLYPSALREPNSFGVCYQQNLPYWHWYSEGAIKIGDKELAEMMLRDSYGPVTTLGAKIISDYNGDDSGVKAIRFGAYYNEDFIRWPDDVKNVSDNVANTTLDADKDNVLNYWDIAEVGMLIAPTQLLSSNSDLVIGTSIKHINAPADPITNWVQGSNLADYDTMVYHVPVKNVPTDMKFTFVPYVDYYDANGTKTYYGIPAERSYNYVLNALGGNINSGETINEFWITHMNDHTTYTDRAGAGMVFTEPYGYNEQNVFEQRKHWMHIAFAPVEGYDDVYEIVEYVDGTPTGANAGEGYIMNIPVGGFVWVGHDSKYDATYDTGSDEAIEIARDWAVGDTIKFYGLNLDDEYNIPTTTPTVDYKDAGYVCTAKVEKVVIVTDESSEEETTVPEEPSEPEVDIDDTVIAYIPLDDRPVNYERVIDAAEAAGFTMLIPPLDDVMTVVNDKSNAISVKSIENQVTRWNTTSFETYGSYIYDDSAIYSTTAFADGQAWWGIVVFDHIGGNEYKITEIINQSAGDVTQPITSFPADGFVWCYNGNKNAVNASGLREGQSVVLTNFDSTNCTNATVDPDESDIGNRVKNYEWIKGIYENGYNGKKVKYYIFAFDQLFSGGLAGDRVFAALTNVYDNDGNPYYDSTLSVEQNLAKWENGVIEFLGTLAADEDTFVVSMDTVMRLASTTTNFLGMNKYDADGNDGLYNALRAYGSQGNQAETVNRVEIDFSGMTVNNVSDYVTRVIDNMDQNVNGQINASEFVYYGYTLEQSLLDSVVFPSRERKFRITQQMLTTLYNKGAQFDYYYIGIADAMPDVISIQNNEIAFHEKLLRLYGFEDTTLTFDGTDELGLNGLAACAQDRYGATLNDNTGKIPVNVTYYGGGENEMADHYGTTTLKQTVDSHLLASGAYYDSVQSNTKLQLLVLSRVPSLKEYTADAYQVSGAVAAQETATQQLFTQLKYNLANDIPTIVINAVGSNGGTAYFGDVLFAETEQVDIMKLYGYSQWNTVGNAVGIAIGNGIARYAYVKDADATGEVSSTKANIGFLKSMTTALVKDLAYIGACTKYGGSYVTNGATRGGNDSVNQQCYNVYKEKLDKIINASTYYTAYGVATDTPHVIIGAYDNLDNWANRNFEAQIPVNINVACGADYTDVVLSDKTNGAHGVYDPATNSIIGFGPEGSKYYGLINDGVYADGTILNDSTERLAQGYIFRSTYDGDILASGTAPVNTIANVGTIIMDLGDVYSLSESRIQYGVYTGSANTMYSPDSIKIYVSEDNVNWSECISEITNFENADDAANVKDDYWVKGLFAQDVEAQYVKIEVTVPDKTGACVFLGEICMVIGNDVTDNAR